MNGLIIVDKPLHKTSFDVIRELRKEYNTRKMGHIGTLDPMATGVLPILVGEATKLSDYLMEHDKEYIATLHLGERRDTGDSEGKVIEEALIPNINKDDIENVLKSFIGESMQIPPMYSAVKINGKKLYELARKGQEVERTARKINIDEIEFLYCFSNIENQNCTCEYNNCDNRNEDNKESANNEIIEFSYRVVCSKGTYIRVLCEDIAKKLGTVGYMKSLRRTRVGNFKIEDAGKFIEMQDILEVPKVEIMDFENVNQSKEILLKKLINGVNIKINEKDGLVNLYNNGDFIGIGQVLKGNLKRKILINIM